MTTNIHSNDEDNKWCDGQCAVDECVCVSIPMKRELERLRAEVEQIIKHNHFLGTALEAAEKELNRLKEVFKPIEAKARLTFDLATMEILLQEKPKKGADRLAQIIVAWSEETQRAEQAEARLKAAENKVAELKKELDFQKEMVKAFAPYQERAIAAESALKSCQKVFIENKRYREALESALNHQVANRGSKHQFYATYTYRVGVMPEWVKQAEQALKEVER
jgi:chromosome segregation ATPase